MRVSSGTESFKGILLQVRSVGASNPVGTWQNFATNKFKTLSCSGISSSALTHSSSASKNIVEAEWLPSDDYGEVEILLVDKS